MGQRVPYSTAGSPQPPISQPWQALLAALEIHPAAQAHAVLGTRPVLYMHKSHWHGAEPGNPLRSWLTPLVVGRSQGCMWGNPCCWVGCKWFLSGHVFVGMLKQWGGADMGFCYSLFPGIVWAGVHMKHVLPAREFYICKMILFSAFVPKKHCLTKLPCEEQFPFKFPTWSSFFKTGYDLVSFVLYLYICVSKTELSSLCFVQ